MARYNLNKIKSQHSYSIQEIAELYNIREETVRRWISPILPNTKPLLFFGLEVIRFIKQERKKRKFTCEPDQMPCFRCKKGVFAINITLHETGRISQGRKQQLRKIGQCPTCSAELNLFISDSPQKMSYIDSLMRICLRYYERLVCLDRQLMHVRMDGMIERLLMGSIRLRLARKETELAYLNMKKAYMVVNVTGVVGVINKPIV